MEHEAASTAHSDAAIDAMLTIEDDTPILDADDSPLKRSSNGNVSSGYSNRSKSSLSVWRDHFDSAMSALSSHRFSLMLITNSLLVITILMLTMHYRPSLHTTGHTISARSTEHAAATTSNINDASSSSSSSHPDATEVLSSSYAVTPYYSPLDWASHHRTPLPHCARISSRVQRSLMTYIQEIQEPAVIASKSGEAHTGFVIFSVLGEGTNGGLIDRQRGVIGSLYMAMALKRPFAIHWEQPAPLREALMPNLIQWDVQVRKPQQ